MGLEGADGLPGSIAAMEIWGHQLVVTIPLFIDDTMIFSSVFIIKNLEVNPVTTLLEVGYNIVVGGNAMAVPIRLEVFDVDGVAVAVVGEHNVLITTVIALGETENIINVELANVGYLNVQLIGCNLW